MPPEINNTTRLRWPLANECMWPQGDVYVLLSPDFTPDRALSIYNMLWTSILSMCQMYAQDIKVTCIREMVA